MKQSLYFLIYNHLLHKFGYNFLLKHKDEWLCGLYLSSSYYCQVIIYVPHTSVKLLVKAKDWSLTPQRDLTAINSLWQTTLLFKLSHINSSLGDGRIITWPIVDLHPLLKSVRWYKGTPGGKGRPLRPLLGFRTGPLEFFSPILPSPVLLSYLSGWILKGQE